VEEESPQKLDGVEGHGAMTTVLGVVLVAEAHFAVVDGEQPLVGDGDPVRIAGEVLEDLSWPAEGRLGINDPVLGAQGPEQSLPGNGMLELSESSMETKLASFEGTMEVGEKLRSEQPAENTVGKKEAVSTAQPALPIEPESTAGDHTMEMRVGVKSLSPGM
jgi:hypothetical protein